MYDGRYEFETCMASPQGMSLSFGTLPHLPTQTIPWGNPCSGLCFSHIGFILIGHSPMYCFPSFGMYVGRETNVKFICLYPDFL